MTDSPSKQPKKNTKVLIFITITFCLCGVLIFCWWFFFARLNKSTKDAYVQGNQVTLTPQVPGIVTAVNIDETQLVVEGQILIYLDAVILLFL